MGHDAGDELLMQVARRLRACVREGDILARLGGDEFTVVLCQLERATTDGIQIAERIVADLRTSFALSMGRADIGGSVGMSFPSDAIQPLSLLKNADVAMYRAKEAGRNTYCLYRAGMATSP